MATIGKIRERSGWAIGLIGIAMLGFIATDLLKNKLFNNGESGSAPKGIGKIYGSYIDPQEFRDRYDKMMKNQVQTNKGEVTLEQQNQISDQAWQELTQELTLKKEADILGLTVTGDEIFDITIGPYPDPIASQYLADPKTHKIDRRGLKNFLENIQDAKPEQQDQWQSLEDYLVSSRIQAKYKTLVNASDYYTDLEMEDDYVGKNRSVSIAYVPVMYNTLEDSTMTVTDKEIQDYYDKHKENDYKSENSRTFEIVSFDDRPSKADTVATYKSVVALEEPWKRTTDDSSFIVTNGTGTFDNKYHPRGSFDAKYEDSIFARPDSSFIGPYYEDSAYKLIKVIDHKTDSLYWYRASHILISNTAKPGDDPATKIADSIDAYNKAKKIYDDAIKPGADFAMLASQNGQDGTAQKGGDLGWFRDGTMVKPFMEAVKKGEKGHIYLVSSQFGTHVLKITAEKTNQLVKAGTLVKPVTVGPETNNAAYNKAVAFRTKAQDGPSYDKASKDMNLTKRLLEKITPNQHEIGGLIHPKELISWAFKDETKVGSVSDPMRLTDRYVVAKMVKVIADGYTPLEDVKNEVKKAVQHEKKKQTIVDKLDAGYSQTKSLDGLAKLMKSSVDTVTGILFENPNVERLANEPALVGAACGSKLNETSKAVMGMNGAFVFTVINIKSITPPTNYDRDRKLLLDRNKSVLESDARQALAKLADLKDYRYEYPM